MPPEGERARTNTADVGSNIKKRVEVKRLRLGITTALDQYSGKPRTDNLPVRVDESDDDNHNPHPPVRKDFFEGCNDV